MATIGILHPGVMGAALGESLQAAGHTVVWSSEGRSAATSNRAAAIGIRDVGGIREIVRQADVVWSLCPPHAAGEVARVVSAAGFSGWYVDANAISPSEARTIAATVAAAGARPIDGAIIAAPPRGSLQTRVLLSGGGAAEVAALFEGSSIATVLVGEDLGAASALKLAFSLVTKGVQAVFATAAALAHGWGLGDRFDELLEDERNSDPAQVMARMPEVAALAWRFASEMDAVAAACRERGLPDGAAAASAAVYRCWDGRRGDAGAGVGDLMHELLGAPPQP